MSNEKHTRGLMSWLKRDDGSLIYIIGDHKTGPHAQGDIHIGEADMRRIAACWNACQRFETDLLERVSRPGCYGIHPAPQDRIDELLEVLEKVLSTHGAECKAELTLSTATENYSDHHPELDAYTEAAVASSKAEQHARDVIAKVKGTTT